MSIPTNLVWSEAPMRIHRWQQSKDNFFFGKTSSSEPSADRATHPFVKTDKAIIMGWDRLLPLCSRVGHWKILARRFSMP